MKKILTDQNFTGAIISGLLSRIPDLDLVRTEDVGIKQSTDAQILSWAASEERLILTHDAKTFAAAAFERLSEGQMFYGVVLVPANLAVRFAIDDLEVLILCTNDDELYDRVIRLPI